MQLDVSIKILLLKDCVDSNEGSMHRVYLLGLQEKTQTIVITTTLIRDDSKILCSLIMDCLDQVFGNAT